jgi:hypothetical protein
MTTIRLPGPPAASQEAHRYRETARVWAYGLSDEQLQRLCGPEDDKLASYGLAHVEAACRELSIRNLQPYVT